MTAIWVKRASNAILLILNWAVYATQSKIVPMIAQMPVCAIFIRANACAITIERETIVRYLNVRLFINFVPTAMMRSVWSASKDGA
jgi:hypothetical protein